MEQFLLFSTIFLPVVRFLCLGRDQIFTSRKAVIRDKIGRVNCIYIYIFSDYSVNLYNYII